jgi:hypothetical protein
MWISSRRSETFVTTVRHCPSINSNYDSTSHGDDYQIRE